MKQRGYGIKCYWLLKGVISGVNLVVSIEVQAKGLMKYTLVMYGNSFDWLV